MRRYNRSPFILKYQIGGRLFLLTVVLALRLAGAADEWTAQTFTYKSISPQGKDLQADVYRPPDDTVRPVIVFIHGGALMMGDRKLNPKAGSLLEALLKAGYAVVSIDYRLAPEVKLPAIIEDVRDACAWVRKRGPELFQIDPG